MLWLNGGPGCSSLEGAFQESGPLWTAAGGKGLQLNNYSWNKFANQLFIEAPACVGFSYADDPSTGCTHTDTSTAADNLQALVQFFTVKFPELAKNDFWISGESYAGIYIPMVSRGGVWRAGARAQSPARPPAAPDPCALFAACIPSRRFPSRTRPPLLLQLAYNVYNYNLKAPAVPIPLKGILVGNGCIGNDVGVCGQDSYSDYLSLFQLYRHVMIADPTWATVIDKCGDFSHESTACQNAIDAAGNEAGNNFNVYDLYSGVWGVCAASALKNPRRPIRPGSVMAKLLAKQAALQAATPANQCTDDDDLTTYMNLPEVQKALNVKAADWTECANIDYSGDMPDERKTIYPTLTQKAGYQVVRVGAGVGGGGGWGGMGGVAWVGGMGWEGGAGKVAGQEQEPGRGLEGVDDPHV